MPNQPPSVHAAFEQRLRDTLADGSFVLLRCRFTVGPSAEVRLVDLKAGPALSFATREGARMMTRNLLVDEGVAEIMRRLASGGTAWMETTGKGWQFMAPPNGRARLVPHRARTTAPRETPVRSHDRAKHSRLDGAGPWLAALGLADADGRPLPSRADKVRQIERYADLLTHFAADCGWKKGDRVTVADMGCGKGYLTFAAWHVLRHGLGLQAHVLGIDAQPDLAAACAAVAKRLGAEGLAFRAGQIGEVELPNLDALIALHACNDATDHAIRRGVAANAQLILVAPCCHKEVRRAMGSPDPLAPILGHGLFRERFAEWLTDGLRTLELEAAGYRVTVAEFIPAEHTPKNVLIGAVRGQTAVRREAAAAESLRIRTWAGLV